MEMAENYLKLKAQSDQRLAIALTKAVKEVYATHIQTVEDVKLGSQRIINYGSCMMPDKYYRSTCHEQWGEDKRLYLSLLEIYKRNDVVLDMVQLYFQKTFKRLGDEKSNTLVSYIKQKIGEKAYESAERTSKMALSLTIAKLIVSSGKFQESYIQKVNEMSSWLIKVVTLYSKAEVAALAANKLKFQDAVYYQVLFREKIEMLYFLIEPQMSKIIYQVESGGNNEEIIGDALYEMLKR
ncbi:hypothetical protein SOJ89_001432 [Cronobacter sakazakii]|nr:hypothetical protein [Cronobacter sakazakii]ELY7521119.1 hypothetical protein [Cronobacter sakazakii]ELZ1658140.1 hypothetical protein [Cronobacter sakazakii]